MDAVAKGVDMVSEKDLPKKILEGHINFITGSVCFGTQNNSSDLDVCVLINSRHLIYKTVNNPVDSDYNNGFKFINDGREINIIPLHPLDFVAWFYASKLMNQMPLLGLKTKAEIHGLHETFIGLMKTQFSKEIVTVDNVLELTGLGTLVGSPKDQEFNEVFGVK